MNNEHQNMNVFIKANPIPFPQVSEMNRYFSTERFDHQSETGLNH